jgi:rod shape-determining protein MreC
VALSRRTSRSPGRSRLTLALLVLTSVTLLTLDYRGFAPIENARSSVLGFFAPVGDAAGSVFEPVGDAWRGAGGYSELADENDQLRQRVQDLESQLTESEAATRELAQLQEQLDLDFAGDLSTVKARVLATGVGNFDQTVEIDKGSDQGIELGMPVVAGAGLVGSVSRVSSSRSVVTLVSDPSSQVGVRLSGKAGLGLVEGTGDPRVLRARAFDAVSDLAEGDILVTAGGERSAFPPDLPVGTVSEVLADDLGLEQQASVDLASELDGLVYVTVLQWRPAP